MKRVTITLTVVVDCSDGDDAVEMLETILTKDNLEGNIHAIVEPHVDSTEISLSEQQVEDEVKRLIDSGQIDEELGDDYITALHEGFEEGAYWDADDVHADIEIYKRGVIEKEGEA